MEAKSCLQLNFALDANRQLPHCLKKKKYARWFHRRLNLTVMSLILFFYLCFQAASAKPASSKPAKGQ